MDIKEALRILKIPLDLKIDRDAVLRSFRRRALETHSDTGGSDEDFIRVYQAYEFLKDCQEITDIIKEGLFDGSEHRETVSKQPLRKEARLSNEVAEQFMDAVFLRYVSQEADYFIKNIGEVAKGDFDEPKRSEGLPFLRGWREDRFTLATEYFDELKKRKELLFLKGWREDRFTLVSSPLDLLNGSLFFDLDIRARLAKRIFEMIISERELNLELLERYIALFDPSADLVTSFPLQGNVRGLELLVLITPPEKSRSKTGKPNELRKRIFGDYWNIGGVQMDLRFGEYWEHSKGLYELKSTPIGSMMKIEQASILIKQIKEGIQSSDFELELSREIPEGHPDYKFFKDTERNLKEGNGFYIKNLRVGDAEVIVDGRVPNYLPVNKQD